MFEEYSPSDMSFKPAIPVLKSKSSKKARTFGDVGINEEKALSIVNDNKRINAEFLK